MSGIPLRLSAKCFSTFVIYGEISRNIFLQADFSISQAASKSRPLSHLRGAESEAPPFWLAGYLRLFRAMSMEEEEWQELCESVAAEKDPHRLSQLIDQLLKALDDRRRALQEHGRKPNPASTASPRGT